MDLQSMPIDILEHILLQLDSPVCLVRASSTCKLWRQITAGAVFLKRIGSLHESPVVGSYSNDNLNLTTPPRFEPAPPATSVASSYLSLEFLSTKEEEWFCKWTIKDSRGSLLLLEKAAVEGITRRHNLYVCEPLTQRLKKITKRMKTPLSHRSETQAFFLDGADPGQVGMSNFRVVCLSPNGSSADVITADRSSRKLSTGNDQGKEMFCIGTAAGSVYWYAKPGTVFAMDQSTAEFSSSSLPDTEVFLQTMISSKFAVKTGPDGNARIVYLGANGKLKIFARRQKGSRGGGDWVLEKSILGPSAAMLGVPKAKNFFLRSVPFSAAETMGMVQIIASTGLIGDSAAFNMDIDKKQLKRTERSKAYPIKLPWPPSLRACTTGDA